MENRIRNAVAGIGEALMSQPVRDGLGGVSGGYLGDLLIFESINKVLQRSDFADYCDALVERTLDAMGRDRHSVTLLTGASGYLWLLEKLHREQRYDFSDLKEVAEDYDAGLLHRLSSPQGLVDYELLYGETGVLHYLLESESTPTREAILTRVIAALRQRATPFHEGLIIYTDAKSAFKRHEEMPLEADLGHAHGYPGTLAVLAQARLSGRVGSEVDDLIDGLARTLVFLRQNEGPSQFGYNHLQRSASRVAWCYGDTCPANALYLAGRALNEPRYLQVAREVVDHIVHRERRAFQTADYAICHGVTSVMFMFSEFYRRYQDPHIAEVRDALIHETLMALEAGERMSDPNVFKDGEDFSFLNGRGGVAVALVEELPGVNRVLPNLLAYFDDSARA